MTLRDMMSFLLFGPPGGERLEVSDILLDMLDGIAQGLDQDVLELGLRDRSGLETGAEAGHSIAVVEDRQRDQLPAARARLRDAPGKAVAADGAQRRGELFAGEVRPLAVVG